MIDWLLVTGVGVLLAVVLLLIVAIIEAYYAEKRAKEGKRDDWIWFNKAKKISDRQKIERVLRLT